MAGAREEVGGVLKRVELELAGHGGDVVRAALFLPPASTEGGASGVVLLAPPYALDAGLEARAARLVDAGFAVLAPDLFTRERGSARDLPELPDRRALADVVAALARLASESGVDPRRIAVVGLGAGGTLAFLSGCHSARPTAVVSLGGRVVRDALSAIHPLQPLEMALNLSCPFLGLFAANDRGLPAGELEHVRAVLSQFARSFDIVSLPGADPDFHESEGADPGAEHARAAWERVVEFLRACVE